MSLVSSVNEMVMALARPPQTGTIPSRISCSSLHPSLPTSKRIESSQDSEHAACQDNERRKNGWMRISGGSVGGELRLIFIKF